MNQKDLWATTLVGPPRLFQGSDPLAVLHLDNWLCMFTCTHSCPWLQESELTDSWACWISVPNIKTSMLCCILQVFKRSQPRVDRGPQGHPQDLLRTDSVRPAHGLDQPRVLHQVDGGHLPHHGAGPAWGRHGPQRRRRRATSTYLVRGIFTFACCALQMLYDHPM